MTIMIAFMNNLVKYCFITYVSHNEPSELLGRSSDMELCLVSRDVLNFSRVPSRSLSVSLSSRGKVDGHGSAFDEPLVTSYCSSDHRRSLSGCICGLLAVAESSDALVV